MDIDQSYRSSFLPENVNKVEISSERTLRHYSQSGFDASGRYFSVQKRRIEVDNEKAIRSFTIFFFKRDCDELESTSINLQSDGRIIGECYYDPFTTRWFIVEKTSNVVYSGCLRQYFEKPCTLLASEDHDFRYQIPEGDYDDDEFSTIMKCGAEQNIIAIQRLLESVLTIKLFEFSDEKVSHLSRVTMYSGPHSCTKSTLFIDTDSSLLYEKNSELIAYDFKGKKKFEIPLLKHDDPSKSPEDRIRAFYQLKNSVFLLIHKNRTAELFKVTSTGEKIDLSTFKLRPFRTSKLIKRFGKHYLCLSQTKTKNGFEIFEVGSWRNINECNKKVQIKTIEDINWSMREMAFISEQDIDGKRSFNITIQNLRLLNDLSLKHSARLACLRTFNEEHFNGKVPKCLLRYLGSLKG